MNKNKIAVIVDSSANLSDKTVQDYNIIVVNQPIMFGNHVYHENLDIDSDEFYRMLKMEKAHPTTSQISMREMQSLFQKLAEDGYEGALCIGLSGGMSGFINSVSATAPAIRELQVFPFDSRSVLAGTGNMAILAAQELDNGRDIHQVLVDLRKLRDQTEVYIAVNNVKGLQNLGNIASRGSVFSSLLGMRPILHMNKQGRLEMVGQEHQIAKAMDAIEEKLAEAVRDAKTPLLVTVIDANDRDRNMQWQTHLAERFPDLILESGEIGPYMGTYTGGKSVGLVWSEQIIIN